MRGLTARGIAACALLVLAAASAHAAPLSLETPRLGEVAVRAQTTSVRQELAEAAQVALALMDDPEFTALIEDQGTLYSECLKPGRPDFLDLQAFLRAWTSATASPSAKPGRPLAWQALLHKAFPGSSGTRNGKIRIFRRHVGLQRRHVAVDGKVHGALVNTVVHEITHLFIHPDDEGTARFWIRDDYEGSCARRLTCRVPMASYRIGNLAQCYVWAKGQRGAWRPRVEECMAAGTDDFGTLASKKPETDEPYPWHTLVPWPPSP